MNHLLLVALALAGLAGCAHRGLDVSGPRTSRVEVYKPWPGADKLYVEVDLGDGEPRMMLLDSGAGTTLLTPQVAQELGLVLSAEVSQYMQVSGVLEARSAVLPEVKLGRQVVRNVHVAVPLEPVHDQAGGVPVAGLLGANVLSNFQVVVDYPANRLELHRAGSRPPPEGAEPLYFDGQHAMTGVVLVGRRDGLTVEEKVLVDVDTGARGLWLFGALSDELAGLASEGMEPVVGVSSGAGLPLRSMLQTTRRIPIVQVHAGGAVVERELEATWTSFGDAPVDLAASSPGLLGHSVLDGHRAVLDYQAQRFALLPAEKVRKENDIHAWRLRTLRKSREEDHLVRMAEVQTWMGDFDDARNSLVRHHRRHPQDPSGTVMLARMQRLDGDTEGAMTLLDPVGVTDLVELGEIVAVVNGRWLAGRPDQALSLAQQAVDALPEHPGAWVALADARRATGDLAGARTALVQANGLAENPDGNLLRRAWIAVDEGDVYAGLTHLRRQLELEPSGLITPWFYGILARESDQGGLLLADLERVRAQLHPGQGALDFLAAAYHRGGRDDLAAELAEQGRTRDCTLDDPSRRSNCEAWYRGVIGADLDEALRLVRSAIEQEPDSSEFLDTLSVVLEAQGDLAGAREASWRAAALSPDDVYLLWQAARLDAAARPPGEG